MVVWYWYNSWDNGEAREGKKIHKYPLFSSTKLILSNYTGTTLRDKIKTNWLIVIYINYIYCSNPEKGKKKIKEAVSICTNWCLCNTSTNLLDGKSYQYNQKERYQLKEKESFREACLLAVKSFILFSLPCCISFNQCIKYKEKMRNQLKNK